MTAPEPDDLDELLVELLALQSRGDRDAIRDLLRNAGEHAHALRGALTLTAELDDLGRLLGENASQLPDELARLGRFERLRPIADGGLARVYRAHDPRLERDVALKILHADHAGAAAARDWILAEGRALAGLQHDSVVRVFEVDEADGLAYVAMEFVDGPNLHDVMGALRELDRADVGDRHGPRAIDAARSLVAVAARLRLVRDLADALESCHLRGVVHRDVKPANVLIDPEGTPKLIDFGLAHRVEASTLGLTQQLVGTPGYLAPEQVENDRTGASPRSDQFSLGTVLYELLTLRHPFQGDGRAATMHAVARATPEPPRRVDASITADVERVCLHALARDPEDRYPSLEAFRDDLDALLELRPISLAPDTLRRQFASWRRRHAKSLVVLSLLFLVVSGGVLFQGARERSEVRAAVSDIARRIGDVRRGDEATPLYSDLIALKESAEELDASRVGRLIHGASMPPLVETAETLARHCGRLFEQDASGLRATALVEAQQGALLMLLSRWQAALHEEQILFGESAPNAGRLMMGTASVPEDCTVWRLKIVDGVCTVGLPLMKNTSREALPIGTYRAVLVDEQELREIEFGVLAWSLATEYRPRRFTSAVPRAAIDSLPDLSIGPDHVFVQAPFELTLEPLRWRDVVDALGPEEVAGLQPGSRARDEFVDGSGNLASEIARRMGGRLPTALELHLSRALGCVELEGFVWTSSRATEEGGNNARLFYDADVPMEELGDELPDLDRWIVPIEADGTRSAGSPRVHLARSLSPEPSRTSRR